VVGDTVRLAVDLGRSAIKNQADQLTDLRSRAGTLLAAASIAGTFAGVTHGSIDTMAALALFAYLCSVGACIYVLLPHDLSTEFRGTVLLSAREEAGASDEEVFEALVQWLEQVRAANNGKLRGLKGWYTAAAAALGVEVVLWILTLAA
jgi:hypothetical protein